MQSDYPIVSRMLHHLALGWPFVGEVTFDIERGLYLKSAPDPAPARHVFVSGLARAGTTVLMREIHRSGQFASVLYADMPFVLCPNAWSKMSRRSGGEQTMRERAHGDGILVNVESPEALDEVFWRVFTRSEYIKQEGLAPHTPDEETLQHYGEFIRLVLHLRNRTRYLSKSCNALLRLPSLRKQFPDAIFLVPVRSPVAHAQSLLSQHKRFMQSDRFTRHYMKWLGHHEFGAHHRPFLWTPEPAQFTDTQTLDYWLEQWIRCYSYLKKMPDETPGHLYFVPYENLCEQPEVWSRIGELIDIPVPETDAFTRSDKPIEDTPDPELAETAEELWTEIQSRSLGRLGIG